MAGGPALLAWPGPTAAASSRRRPLAASRAAPLPAGRPVAPRTRDRRRELVACLRSWLAAVGRPTLEELLRVAPSDALPLNEALVAFGQQLWLEEAPYWKYAESVNAVAQLQPLSRGTLGFAWSLAYTWISEEPGQHHIALPSVCLAALVALALFWGWPRIAALVGAGFAGMMRPSDFLLSRRRFLVLPRDALGTTSYTLFQIMSPKTRATAGRHQVARVDPPDIVELLDGVFGCMPPSARLWPHSQSTFRARFVELLRALGLPWDRSARYAGFDPGEVVDLGSLRSGGATALWCETEDAEFTRQRGRWLNVRVMQIYLQETMAVGLLSRLPAATRARVQLWASHAPRIQQQAVAWLREGVPPDEWYDRWHSVPALGP